MSTDNSEELKEETIDENQTEQEAKESEEADFEAGFGSEEAEGEVSHETKAEADPEPEPKQEETAPVQSEAPPAQADSQETASPKADPLMDRLSQLENRQRQIEGRVGGIQGHLKSMSTQDKSDAHEVAAKAAEKQGAESPTKGQLSEALKSGEKYQELVEEFPEWGAAMEEFSAIISKQVQPADTEGLKKEVRGDMVQMTSRAMHEVREIVRIDAAHPNWESTVKTPEFRDWIRQQPIEMQKKYRDSRSATDAIEVLSSFKDRQVVSQQDNKAGQQRRLEANIGPSGTNTPAPTAKTDEQEFLAAFNG